MEPLSSQLYESPQYNQTAVYSYEAEYSLFTISDIHLCLNVTTLILLP